MQTYSFIEIMELMTILNTDELEILSDVFEDEKHLYELKEALLIDECLNRLIAFRNL